MKQTIATPPNNCESIREAREKAAEVFPNDFYLEHLYMKFLLGKELDTVEVITLISKLRGKDGAREIIKAIKAKYNVKTGARKKIEEATSS